MKPTALWAAHLGTETSLPAVVNTAPDLKHTLDSLVVSNWNDLMANDPGGQVDIEYRIAADGSIEYLRLWACSRGGFCDLICQYSMFWKWSNTEAVSFGPRYKAKALAEQLNYVLQHQGNFSSLVEPGRMLLQVRPPSDQERDAAHHNLSAAFAA
ncbi:MAG TPA: hypothetical protein VFP40_06595 [Terriglobales bacterium]|nr:hypothetical protein [Terriglobales bacterium]